MSIVLTAFASALTGAAITYWRMRGQGVAGFTKGWDARGDFHAVVAERALVAALDHEASP